MELWSKETGLYLFTKEEYDKLPDGFVLTCIDGTERTKGVDYIDLDTRFGYLAYGVVNPAEHPDQEILLMIKLSCSG